MSKVDKSIMIKIQSEDLEDFLFCSGGNKDDIKNVIAALKANNDVRATGGNIYSVEGVDFSTITDVFDSTAVEYGKITLVTDNYDYITLLGDVPKEQVARDAYCNALKGLTLDSGAKIIKVNLDVAKVTY